MPVVDLAFFSRRLLSIAHRHRLTSATREQAAHGALQEAQRALSRAYVTALDALGGREALVARLVQALADEEEEDGLCGSPSPT